MEKLGLVLCGGGARGAFEVGVWEALDELGITNDITGISGTSIGAVNTALFLSDVNNKEKEDKWKSFKQSDMLSPNIDIGSRNIFFRKILTKWNLLATISDVLISGIFTQRALAELLNGLNLDNEKLEKMDVFTSVTDLSLGHVHTAYIDWKIMPERKIKRYVKYSAKIPVINGAHISEKRIGHLLVDGGLRDFHDVLKRNLSNTPIAPLYAKGYRKFIVVYLSEPDNFAKQLEIENEWFSGSEICRIFYDRPKKLSSVLLIDEEKTSRRIEAGKKAVMDMIESSSDKKLKFVRTQDGQNDETISRTITCIQRGEKVVNGKVQYYID